MSEIIEDDIELSLIEAAEQEARKARALEEFEKRLLTHINMIRPVTNHNNNIHYISETLDNIYIMFTEVKKECGVK